MTAETLTPPELEILTQGAVDVLPQAGLAAKLKEGRPLRVKLGFDPTKPDLHLGHAVVLNALRRFQDLGHQVVLIIGDFTARIGDPTGKEATRPPLSGEEIDLNAKTYLEQLGLIIDLSKAEIHHNGAWLDKLTFTDTIRLAAHTTVAQMLARENFAKRFERNDPIALHEFLYPLMQGYDSIAIKADVELGGTDQKFNLLMGRQLQEAYGQSPQVVMTFPILEGTDGVQKMSKSLGNYIGLTDSSDQMFGKVMSIPDNLLENYYRLASGLPLVDIETKLAQLKEGTLSPRDAKVFLASTIVNRYHRELVPLSQEQQHELSVMTAAQKLVSGCDLSNLSLAPSGTIAELGFIKQFQQKQLPDDIPQVVVSEPIPLAQLLVHAKLATGTSEARRLVQQGGVKLHRGDEPETVQDVNQVVDIPAEGLIVQVGKRRFARITRP